MQIDPRWAVGMTLLTAATDAVYVIFSASVAAQAGSGSKLEQRVISAFRVRGDQLYAQLGARPISDAGFLDWRVLVDDMAEEAVNTCTQPCRWAARRVTRWRTKTQSRA
jgi:hypothetical protein